MDKIKFFFVGFLISIEPAFSQNEAESFLIDNKVATYKNQTDTYLDFIQFQNPEEIFIDLDKDSINEYLIIDKKISLSHTQYFVYLFYTKKEFFIIDSINSGIIKPSIQFSDELNQFVLVTGYSKFDSLLSTGVEDTIYSPLNCWIKNDNQLLNINDKLYELFLQENEILINQIQKKFQTSSYICDTTIKLKSMLISAYINYLNAMEKTFANELIKKYYLCKDFEKLIKFIKESI